MARNKALSSETRQSIYVPRNYGYSNARNCQETEDLVQRCVLLPSQNSALLSLTRIESGVGGPGAQLSKSTSTLECLV